MELNTNQLWGLTLFIIGMIPLFIFVIWLLRSTDKDLEELKRYKQEKRELN
jgi:hypothetical protein